MPDAFSAVALSSFLDTPDRISYPILFDGSYAVFVHGPVHVPLLKERIRLWADLQGLEEIIVYLDEDVQDLVAEG